MRSVLTTLVLILYIPVNYFVWLALNGFIPSISVMVGPNSPWLIFVLEFSMFVAVFTILVLFLFWIPERYRKLALIAVPAGALFLYHFGHFLLTYCPDCPEGNEAKHDLLVELSIFVWVHGSNFAVPLGYVIAALVIYGTKLRRTSSA